MNVRAAVREFCLTQRTVWIAYSGGLDSQVLLSLCHELSRTQVIQLRAVHIHHGLNPGADQWAAHCRQFCLDAGIEYVERRLALRVPTGESVENVARTARYQVFAELLQEGETLLTAHHQDDQAETLLLQLLRGAGPKGLAAMPALKAFGRGWHGRPLLPFSRGELQQFAQEHGLRWVEDDSNTNPAMARNFIRHQVLPVLNSRWPGAQQTLARSAGHCAEAQALLEEFALDACINVAGSSPGTLSVSKLLILPPERQRLILRSWIYQAGYPMPGAAKLATILRTVLRARWDRRPFVHWPGAELRRHRDDLHIHSPLAPHDPRQVREWRLDEALILPVGVLSTEAIQDGGLRADLPRVSVRFRQGGEIAHLARRKHKELKKLFQEWNVLPWQRDRIPLLFDGDKLIAAVGYFIDPDYSAGKGEKGLGIVFEDGCTDRNGSPLSRG